LVEVAEPKSPTTEQSVDDETQATPFRPAKSEEKAVPVVENWSPGDQVVPPSVVAEVASSLYPPDVQFPTAVQSNDDVQATPSRVVMPESVTGVVPKAPEPEEIESVSATPAVGEEPLFEPTTTQDVALGHATPASTSPAVGKVAALQERLPIAPVPT
jgi:hypothetical protein